MLFIYLFFFLVLQVYTHARYNKYEFNLIVSVHLYFQAFYYDIIFGTSEGL